MVNRGDTPHVYDGLQTDYSRLLYSEFDYVLSLPIQLSAGYGTLKQGSAIAKNASALTTGNKGQYVPYNPTTVDDGAAYQPGRAFLIDDIASGESTFQVTMDESYKFKVGDDVIINTDQAAASRRSQPVADNVRHYSPKPQRQYQHTVSRPDQKGKFLLPFPLQTCKVNQRSAQDVGGIIDGSKPLLDHQVYVTHKLILIGFPNRNVFGAILNTDEDGIIFDYLNTASVNNIGTVNPGELIRRKFLFNGLHCKVDSIFIIVGIENYIILKGFNPEYFIIPQFHKCGILFYKDLIFSNSVQPILCNP